MSFLKKIFAYLFIFVVTLSVTAEAQNRPVFNKEKLNAYLDTLFQNDKFMGSVALDSAGVTVYSKSVGYRDMDEPNLKSDRHTVYRIGSVTKTFTATLIFQLIEEGRLSLSTQLSEYYPEIPQADAITIEHLLRHQSGLFNFTNAEDYTEWMTEERTKEQMLDLFRNQETQFEPGEKVSYSNTNYVLLGYILEDITGRSYARLLEQRIAGPLGLERTYFGGKINTEEGEAASFHYDGDQWTKLPETNMFIPHGAGAIVSTTEDMLVFIRSLFNGELVSQESLDKMTGLQQRFGMGLFGIPFYDKTAYGHTGGIDGFQSNLAYFPEQEVGIAFAGNGLSYSMNEILIGVLSIYFGRNFAIPTFDQKSITLSHQQMQRYTGNYTSKMLPMEIRVFVEDSALKAQATGQSSFRLTATDGQTMRFDPAGIVMEFDSLAAGRYQRFILKQSGGQFLFKREE